MEVHIVSISSTREPVLPPGGMSPVPSEIQLLNALIVDGPLAQRVPQLSERVARRLTEHHLRRFARGEIAWGPNIPPRLVGVRFQPGVPADEKEEVLTAEFRTYVGVPTQVDYSQSFLSPFVSKEVERVRRIFDRAWGGDIPIYAGPDGEEADVLWVVRYYPLLFDPQEGWRLIKPEDKVSLPGLGRVEALVSARGVQCLAQGLGGEVRDIRNIFLARWVRRDGRPDNIVFATKDAYQLALGEVSAFRVGLIGLGWLKKVLSGEEEVNLSPPHHEVFRLLLTMLNDLKGVFPDMQL